MNRISRVAVTILAYFLTVALMISASSAFASVVEPYAKATPKFATKKQLETETAARISADSTESNARQAADTAEANTRQSTDNALSAAINDSIHFIGEEYGGGIVFYVYDGGRHGLIAAKTDQSAGIRWYGGTNTNTRARGNGVGAGKANTVLIIANQATVDGNPFAATVCHEYSVIGADGVTYGDWYLPSRHELDLLYQQRSLVGATSTNYWSSTEENSTSAWSRTFLNGGFGVGGKAIAGYAVRAIRAF